MTISEIAKLAGVAPATVSRYLNNGYVSKEKKAIIKKVIDETGYVPLPSAQTMRTGRSHMIAVIVPKLNSESISEMVDGITSGLSGTGYNPILANTSNSVTKELEYLRIFKENDVDGVILIGTVITDKHHEIMKAYNKPIVILSQFDSNYSCVYYDNYSAARMATEHLIRMGCRKIANIYVIPSDKAAGENRIKGFRDALDARGVVYDKRLSEQSNFTLQGGYDAMKRIVDKKIEFDGLFCATDTIAMGARCCLTDNGIQIPEQVRVASVGDSRMAEVLRPSLTSVHLHYRTGGKEAVNIILEKIKDNDNIIKQYKLGCDLIVRASTK